MSMDKYAAIIDMEHHTSVRHPRMSLEDRAAQFAPFAALTGYDAAISETARLTDMRAPLDDERMSLLNSRMNTLRECLGTRPELNVTYFKPDQRKAGGSYQTVSGRLRDIDDAQHRLVLASGKTIVIEDIYDIEIR